MPRSKVTGDAQQVRSLLAWSRGQGFELTRITVGGCTVDVAAIKVELPRTKAEPRKDDRKTIYAQFGGKAIEELPEDMGGEWEPVVGRK